MFIAGGAAGKVGGGRRSARPATFERATRVTAQRSGRRVTLVNRNAFTVRVRVGGGRRKVLTVAVGARTTRTVRVPVARGRLQVTAIDPAGTTRTVTVGRACTRR